MVDHRAYRNARPKPGELVVYRSEDAYMLKRLIAVAGNTISGKDNVVFVDGKPLSEPYVQHISEVPSRLAEFPAVQVPPGMLFVAGDNRDVSYDSRTPQHGLVSERRLVGRAMYIARGASWDREGADLFTTSTFPSAAP